MVRTNSRREGEFTPSSRFITSSVRALCDSPPIPLLPISLPLARRQKELALRQQTCTPDEDRATRRSNDPWPVEHLGNSRSIPALKQSRVPADGPFDLRHWTARREALSGSQVCHLSAPPPCVPPS